MTRPCKRCTRHFFPNTIGRPREYCGDGCKREEKRANEARVFRERRESLVHAGVDPDVADVASRNAALTEKLLRGKHERSEQVAPEPDLQTQG